MHGARAVEVLAGAAAVDHDRVVLVVPAVQVQLDDGRARAVRALGRRSGLALGRGVLRAGCDVDGDALDRDAAGPVEAQLEGVVGRRVVLGPVAPGGDLGVGVDAKPLRRPCAGPAASSAVQARRHWSRWGRSIPGRSENSGMKHSGAAEAAAVDANAQKSSAEPRTLATIRVAMSGVSVHCGQPHRDWRDCHVAGRLVGGQARCITDLTAPAETRFAPIPRAATMARDFAYLVLGLPAGIAAFTFAVTGLALGAGLAITLVGVPILLLTLLATRWIARFERARARLVVGEPVTADRPLTGTAVERAKALARDRGAWGGVAWSLLLPPVGVAGFTVAVTLWSTALGLPTSPAWYWAVPGDDGRSRCWTRPRSATRRRAS